MNQVIKTEKVASSSFVEKLDKVFLDRVISPLASLTLLLLTLLTIFSINTSFPLNIVFQHIGLKDLAEWIEENSLSGLLGTFFPILGDLVRYGLTAMNIPVEIIDLITDGITAGVGSVLGFYPLILQWYI